MSTDNRLHPADCKALSLSFVSAAGLQGTGHAKPPGRAKSASMLCVNEKQNQTQGLPGQFVLRQEAGGQAKMVLVRSPSEALVAVAPSSHWRTA